MNILFHSWAYYPNGGGVGSYLCNMAEALAEYGHRVIVLTGQSVGKPEIEKKQNLTVLRQYTLAEIGTRKVLNQAMDAIDHNSIDWIEGADYLGDCARLLKTGHRPPVLIKVHGFNLLDVLRESQVLFPWQRPLIKAAILRNWKVTLREKQSIERADVLAAPSGRIIEEMEKQQIRLPVCRNVIPNPVVLDNGKTCVEADAPTLLLVARLDIGKGIQYIPAILQKLSVEFPHLKIEIAGADSYARGIGSLKKWLIKETGRLADRLCFLGQLGREDLRKAYQRSWVVIVPSRWDNFPTVILEAMSHKKPVVASPHGGMPEMLAGTLCKIARPDTEAFSEEIAGLLRDASLRKAAGESMFKKAAKEYAPNAIAALYTHFVERFLKASSNSNAKTLSKNTPANFSECR